MVTTSVAHTSDEIEKLAAKGKAWILSRPRKDCQMVGYDKGNGQRLLVGFTKDRASKDNCNREKGIRRLEKAYAVVL